MKKAVFIILIIFIFMPSKSFAFDICGWWQSQKTPSALLKITKEKFYGVNYKINSRTDNKFELVINNSETPCYIENKGEDAMTFINIFGKKEDYKLVTRDTNLKKKDVRKLCGID